MRIPIESSTSYRGRNSRPNWVVLAVFVGTALAVGGVGAIFSPGVSASATSWYAALVKPSWTPPNEWFGPVWTVLYCLMGTAGWLVWSERYHRARAAALLAYGMQLLLNACWAPLFFGLRSVGAGLFVMLALCLALIWTFREFVVLKTIAALLLIPYVAWTGLALALNLSLWRLNP